MCSKIQTHPLKPTVLHIAGSFFQRSETFLYNQITGVSRWSSTLACEQRLNESEFPIPGIDVHLCSVENSAWLRLYDRVARKCGIAGTGHRRFERGMQRGLNEALARINPGVVHAHFGVNGVIAEPVCKAAGVPLITSFYGYDSAQPGTELSAGWFYAHYPRLFATADRIIVEGPVIARRLELEWGCPPEKLRVLRIGIPARAIRYQPKKPLGHRAVQLLFCGRLVEKKGLLVLLSALTRFKLNGARFHLRVIGDGPLHKAVRQLIQQNGLNEEVTLLGMQPRARFWEELGNCDLLVVPSQTASNGDTEGGAPTVLLEAQAAGVPIVSTDHADIPFIVVPGRSAFLAKESDVASLTEKLVEACSHSERWPEMGATGRQFVLENHENTVVCERLCAIYDEVAGKRGDSLGKKPKGTNA